MTLNLDDRKLAALHVTYWFIVVVKDRFFLPCWLVVLAKLQ
jgi:hypothetical protein